MKNWHVGGGKFKNERRIGDEHYAIFDQNCACVAHVFSEADALLMASAIELKLALDAARAELEAVKREADRLRHGAPVDGDFVCPNELRVATLEAERDRLTASFMDGEHDCDVCGRVTANGTCTECRHGRSPLLIARAERDLAQAEATEARRQRDEACSQVAVLREAFLRVSDALVNDENLHETNDDGDVCEGSPDGCECELVVLINSTASATAETAAKRDAETQRARDELWFVPLSPRGVGFVLQPLSKASIEQHVAAYGERVTRAALERAAKAAESAPAPCCPRKGDEPHWGGCPTWSAPAVETLGCAHGRAVGQPCPHCMGIGASQPDTKRQHLDGRAFKPGEFCGDDACWCVQPDASGAKGEACGDAVPECGGLRRHPYDSQRCCCAYDPDSPVHDMSGIARGGR